MRLGTVQGGTIPVTQDFSALWPVLRLATDCSAFDNIGGNSLLLLAARRRMPAQAIGDKEYFSDTVGSNISTSEQTEHPYSSLRHTEVLRIKH
jgi:hypothetical protein